LDPAARNTEILLPRIDSGENVLLYGARASGKTTRAFRMQEQLQQKYSVLGSSFIAGIRFGDKKVFWNTFGRELMISNQTFKIPKISSALDFANMFKLENLDTIFQNKRVVLFIDDFHRLNSANKEVVDSFLDVFRLLKLQNNHNCFHSLVGNGLFSILKFCDHSESPFNIASAIQSPHWTLEEVAALFREFEEDRGIKLDFRIIQDVYARTCGYSVLVCMCGKAMDEILLKRNATTEFDDWIRYATVSLPVDMDQYPTFMKLSHVLSKDNPDINEIVEFLYHTFLPAKGSVKVTRSHRNRRICEFLTFEGALRHDGGDFFSIPSPLVRSLVFDRIVHKATRRPIPRNPPPLRGADLNVEELLKTCLLSLEESFSSGSVLNDFINQEYSYQVELGRILRNWLPHRVRIYTQYNLGGLVGSNIVISLCDYSFILAIVHSDSEKVVQERFAMARDYAHYLKSKECWILHITNDPLFTFSDRDPGFCVNVLNVYHDLNLSRLWIRDLKRNSHL
jgi:hypothetical protein